MRSSTFRSIRTLPAANTAARMQRVSFSAAALRRRGVKAYLAEFEYRFNRRYDLTTMIPRLTWAAVRTTPMPYRLLKLAEGYA
jgi:hypothetical protein